MHAMCRSCKSIKRTLGIMGLPKPADTCQRSASLSASERYLCFDACDEGSVPESCKASLEVDIKFLCGL